MYSMKIKKQRFILNKSKLAIQNIILKNCKSLALLMIGRKQLGSFVVCCLKDHPIYIGVNRF